MERDSRDCEPEYRNAELLSGRRTGRPDPGTETPRIPTCLPQRGEDWDWSVSQFTYSRIFPHTIRSCTRISPSWGREREGVSPPVTGSSRRRRSLGLIPPHARAPPPRKRTGLNPDPRIPGSFSMTYSASGCPHEWAPIRLWFHVREKWFPTMRHSGDPIYIKPARSSQD